MNDMRREELSNFFNNPVRKQQVGQLSGISNNVLYQVLNVHVYKKIKHRVKL